MIILKNCFSALIIGCLLFFSCTFTPSALAQSTDTLEVATFNVESPRFCSGDTISETDPQIGDTPAG